MPNLGAPELIVIVVVALLLFGAGRIADIGKGLGQGIKNFKQGLREASEDEEAAAKKDPKVERADKPARKEAAKEKEAAEEA